MQVDRKERWRRWNCIKSRIRGMEGGCSIGEERYYEMCTEIFSLEVSGRGQRQRQSAERVEPRDREGNKTTKVSRLSCVEDCKLWILLYSVAYTFFDLEPVKRLQLWSDAV